MQDTKTDRPSSTTGPLVKEGAMHIKRSNVEQNFHMRRLCDGQWTPMQDIVADPRYPTARPICQTCKGLYQRCSADSSVFAYCVWRH